MVSYGMWSGSAPISTHDAIAVKIADTSKLSFTATSLTSTPVPLLLSVSSY